MNQENKNDAIPSATSTNVGGNVNRIQLLILSSACW